jgi:hypothetical protein
MRAGRQIKQPKGNSMKTITRFNICVPMAAMLLTAALAIPAAAQKQVPFKGSMQGNDQDIGSTDTTFTVRTTATGIGSHIGQFSFVQTWTVDDMNQITGSAQWTAANGDTFNTTLTGLGEPTDTPELFRITETHVITGGTGRFAGVRGVFVMERFANGATFVTSGSFHGNITPPGAAH